MPKHIRESIKKVNIDYVIKATPDQHSISDVNLPVKYVCGKRTDFLPVKYDSLNSYQ